jgi:hypothetical protein
MIAKVTIGQVMADTILALMRAQGKKGDELAVLLAGRLQGTNFAADRLIIPAQYAHQSRYGCGLVIEGGCLNRVGPPMRVQGRRILGLMHSHPGRAGHSPIDEAGVLMRFHDAFSLVVPNFGANRDIRKGMAAYRFDYDEGWLETDADTFLHVTDNLPFELITDDFPVS